MTRGCALKLGRNYITIEDIHIAIKVALSTASQERIAVLDLLLKKKGGAITVSTIANALSMSKSTALKTMTELEAVGIADLDTVSVEGNNTKQIRLQNEFKWLCEEEFLKLRGDYSPVDQSKYDIEYQKEPKIEAFWSKYGELERASGDGIVEEKKLNEKLLNETSGIFVGPIEIEILIEKMIQSGEICRGIQGLCKKDARTASNESQVRDAEGV